MNSPHLSMKQLLSNLSNYLGSLKKGGLHLRVCPPLSAGNLPQTLQKQSCKNHQGHKPPG